MLLTYCSNPSISGKTYLEKEYLNQDQAMNPLWDDDQAEVATYDAERVVYGKPCKFEYTYALWSRKYFPDSKTSG